MHHDDSVWSDPPRESVPERAPSRFLLTRFTNASGERVSQVFLNGTTLTRENPDEQAARDYAWDAYSRHNGSATLSEWDGDAGTPEREIARKDGRSL